MITVASDGSGKYTTVQAALNSVSASNTTPTQIRISPGTYQEKLALKSPYVTLCGQAGKAATTTLTYNDTHETFDGSGGTLGTTGSATAAGCVMVTLAVWVRVDIRDCYYICPGYKYRVP